jgi:hypothetical protein
VIPLHNVELKDIEMKDLDSAIENVQPLSLNSLPLTDDEEMLVDEALEHAVLSIIINHDGEDFGNQRTSLGPCLPQSTETIAVHTTDLYPLPSMEIDENTINGNTDSSMRSTRSSSLIRKAMSASDILNCQMAINSQFHDNDQLRPIVLATKSGSTP